MNISMSIPASILISRFKLVCRGGVVALLLVACTPTVQIATPEPITVNLNVKIQHEIYVKVDKDVDELFEDRGLF